MKQDNSKETTERGKTIYNEKTKSSGENTHTQKQRKKNDMKLVHNTPLNTTS